MIESSNNITIDLGPTAIPYKLKSIFGGSSSPITLNEIDMTPEGRFIHKIRTKYNLQTDWDAYDWILEKLEVIERMENMSIEEIDKITNGPK